MSTIHFLNVGKGDCTIIQRNNGHNTTVDICKGNYSTPSRTFDENFAEPVPRPPTASTID